MEQYEKLKNLGEWPPKDAYDLHYSHRMIWNAALSTASEAQTQATPPEPQHGREPKPKPLAQYLSEYIDHELCSNTDHAPCSAHGTWHELLEQALEAYESTEQVKIRIEQV